MLQRWVEVRAEGVPLEYNNPMLPTQRSQETLELPDNKLTYPAPFCSTWLYGKGALLADQVNLSEAQLNQLGSLEIVEFEDRMVERMADKIIEKTPFYHFERLDRCDKYIICRRNNNQDAHRMEHADYYKYVKDRMTFQAGDLRISFYQATCPAPVFFLAKQV